MLMAACSVEVICISFQRTGAHRFIHSFPTRRSSDLIEIAGLPELTTVGARRGHTLDSKQFLQPAFGSGPLVGKPYGRDRKSTRLNSSHLGISYAVFCLKKKNQPTVSVNIDVATTRGE